MSADAADRVAELRRRVHDVARLGDRVPAVSTQVAGLLVDLLVELESCIEKRAEQSDEPVARFRIWTADRMEVIVQGTINGESCWRTYVGTVTTAGELIWRTDSVSYSPPVDWNDLPLPGWKVSEL